MKDRAELLALVFRLILIAMEVLGLSTLATARPAPNSYPRKLSQWPLFTVEAGQLRLKEGVLPYGIVNPLFSDYAVKFRTISLPDASKMTYRGGGGIFQFPIGSVLSKTFAYPSSRVRPSGSDGSDPVGLAVSHSADTPPKEALHLIETRLLFLTGDGWIGLPYVWNKEQTDADLKVAGARLELDLKEDELGESVSFSYEVPNINQCLACHSTVDDYTRTLKPIGLTAGNLNRPIVPDDPTKNQLQLWQSNGRLEALPELAEVPRDPAWSAAAASLDERARSYLHSNCAHCHNPQGAAAPTGLFLGRTISQAYQLGICKSPVAIGNAGGGRMFDIVPGHPDESILFYRLQSIKPSIRMPELGRHLPHQRGLDIIYQWISQVEGACQTPEP